LEIYKGLATPASPCCPANTVDELVTVLGWVVLNDPINIRYIYAPRCQVCCQQHSVVLAGLNEGLCFELIIDLRSLLLVNLSMQLKIACLLTVELSQDYYEKVN
jgi:hypothetical protein